MAFCVKCGKENMEGAAFCCGCGSPLAEQTIQKEPAKEQTSQDTASSNNFWDYTKTEDTTSEYTAEDISKNRVMAIFAYILFLIPLFAAKESRYARFHTNQGMIITIASAAISFTTSFTATILKAISWRFYGFANFINIIGMLICLGAIPLTVFGIIYAAKGKAKELPLVSKIKILK